MTQYLEPYFTGPVVKAITDDCSKGVDCLPTMFGTDVDRKYLVKMVGQMSVLLLLLVLSHFFIWSLHCFNAVMLLMVTSFC